MAWRPHDNLIEGELDNRTPGRVSGRLQLVGLACDVALDLAGDMTGELRGKRIVLRNPDPNKTGKQMRGFRTRQVGPVDSIEVLGRVPAGSETRGAPVGGILHAAWYDEENGRVVMELPQAAWRIAD